MPKVCEQYKEEEYKNMKNVVEFELNNLHWSIIELDNKSLTELRKKHYEDENDKPKENSFYYGYCRYTHHQIYLNSYLCDEEIKKTLIHELMHAYLWSHGSSYSNYCEEALCETIAAAYDTIHEIVERFFKERKWKKNTVEI